MKRMQVRVAGLFGVVLLTLFCNAALAQKSDRPIARKDRLPCDGVVSLYYGEELIWKKGPNKIRAIEALVDVPEEGKKRIKGLPLNSLLSLRPNIAAIELESCKPRLRRFDRDELESDKGAALYLVATNYRGFRLRNIARQRGGGGGMKNIGKIVLVPAADRMSSETAPLNKKRHNAGSGSGEGSGGGSGQGTGQKPGKQPGEPSVKKTDGDLTP